MVDRADTVLVVGSLHYDIFVEADHLPRRDETAVGSRWFPKFGGKGGNQAVSAAANGVAARMVGAVGDDTFGQFLRDGLVRGGVEAHHVATVSGVGSGMSVAIMDRSGDYAATIVSGANLLISTENLTDSEIWQDVGLLVLQNEVPERVNLACATEARRRGIPTLLNAAPSRALSDEFSRLVDILVVNAVEAEMMGTNSLHSLQDALTAADTLVQRYDAVIVTAGSLGLAAAQVGGDSFAMPAEQVQVVSSHGAGDAFIGALAANLVRKVSFQAACAAASHAAAEHVAGRIPG